MSSIVMSFSCARPIVVRTLRSTIRSEPFSRMISFAVGRGAVRRGAPCGLIGCWLDPLRSRVLALAPECKAILTKFVKETRIPRVSSYPAPPPAPDGARLQDPTAPLTQQEVREKEGKAG